MLNRFENRCVIITGAASGIGKAAAVRIASEGGNVGLIDLNQEGLDSAAAELKQFGTKVFTATCDVSDFEASGKAVNELAEKLGGVHALSHNAGIAKTYLTHEMTPAQWNELISVNLTGTFNINRHCIPHLLKNEASYLVNCSSIAAKIRHPYMAAYAASKGGVLSFTKSLYIEYFQQGLRANCILPGGVETPLARSVHTPEGADRRWFGTALSPFRTGKLIQPEKVAAVIAMLCSDDAAAITGGEISVDNGFIH